MNLLKWRISMNRNRLINEAFSVWLLVTPILLLATSIIVLVQKSDINDYKSQIKDKDAKIVEIQLNYEKIRGERDNLQQDLADNTQTLYEKNKELAKERAARRASRSRTRQVRTAPSSSERKVGLGGSTQHDTSTFSGGLRDITMYCPTGNSTASGKRPQRGMVATISRNIPFGTHVVIEGLGEYVVEDRIGSGSEFDIFTPACAEANQFGRKSRRVTILGEN